MPTILLEFGFVDDARDVAQLKNPHFLNAAGEAVAIHNTIEYLVKKSGAHSCAGGLYDGEFVSIISIGANSFAVQFNI